MTQAQKLFWFVFVAKIGMLITFLALFGPNRLIWSDANSYLDIGRNIFAGNGFALTSQSGYIPDAIRTPLYPALLGFFDVFIPRGVVWVSILQALAAALIAVLAYKIGTLFLNPGGAISAALFISFEPLIAAINLLIMPETFLVLFVLTFVYFFIGYLQKNRPKDFYLALIFLTLAVYTKPVATYLFLIPLVFLLFRKSIKKALIFFVVLFLLLSPWMYRNYLAFNSFDVTRDDTGNLCSWELTAIIATKYRVDSSNWNTTNNLPEYQNIRSRCKDTLTALKIYVTEYPRELFWSSVVSAASMLTNEGYTTFFEKPPEKQVKIHHNYLTPAVFVMRDWPQKIKAAFFELDFNERILVLAGKFIWILASLLALVGAWRLLVEHKSLIATFLFLIILYFVAVTVLSTGFGVGARLRYPIDLFIVIFALVGYRRLIYGI